MSLPPKQRNLTSAAAAHTPWVAQVQDGDCPHLLFYGPSGAGKKTLVLALLRQIYGPGVERVKVESKDWKVEVGSRNVEVELVMLSSNYHVEMNPSDCGTKDKLVVQEVIKEMARGRLLGVEGARAYKGTPSRSSSPHAAPLTLADTRARLSVGPKRGRQAVARGPARAAPHDGAVLGHVPPDPRLQQHLESAGRAALANHTRASACTQRA
jgi:energy-coupling factor transporter ATP-binding protein EcfA2